MNRLDLWAPVSLVTLLLALWLNWPELPRPELLSDFWWPPLSLVLALLALVMLIVAMSQQQRMLRQRADKAIAAQQQSHLQIERMQFDQRRATLVTKQAEKERIARAELVIWSSEDLDLMARDIARLVPSHNQAAHQALASMHRHAQDLRALAELDADHAVPVGEEFCLDDLLGQAWQRLKPGQQDLIILDWQDQRLHLSWPKAWADLFVNQLLQACLALGQRQQVQLSVLAFIHAEMGEVVRFSLQSSLRLDEKSLRRALRYSLFLAAKQSKDEPELGLALAFVGHLVSRLGGNVISEQEGLVFVLPKHFQAAQAKRAD